MARVTIELNYPPHATTLYGDNAYYTGKHWAQRKKDAELWHTLLKLEAPWDRAPLRSPVRITFWWDDRLDLSNHSIMGKMIEDGIKGRIIQDDSRKHVVEIVHRWWDGGRIRVEVEEVDDD